MLITLAISGMYWVEYREAMRYFDSITTRIFVCVELDAALALAENLEKQMLFRGISKELSAVTAQILNYYKGAFETSEEIKIPIHIKRFKRWSKYVFYQTRYQILKQGQEHGDQTSKLKSNPNLELLKDGALKSKDPFEIRQYDLIELKYKGLNTDDLEALRLKDNPNLVTAELCLLMSEQTNSDKRKAIYIKSAKNLAPNTYFSR